MIHIHRTTPLLLAFFLNQCQNPPRTTSKVILAPATTSMQFEQQKLAVLEIERTKAEQELKATQKLLRRETEPFATSMLKERLALTKATLQEIERAIKRQKEILEADHNN